MKRPIPTSTLLRFPLIFGSFLLIVGGGLVYKQTWLGDIEKARNEIFKDEPNVLISDFKKEYNRKVEEKNRTK